MKYQITPHNDELIRQHAQQVGQSPEQWLNDLIADVLDETGQQDYQRVAAIWQGIQQGAIKTYPLVEVMKRYDVAG